MDEPASSDGHRKILTDQGTSANTMGYGHAAGKNCFSSFDVGDSGTMKNAVIPKIPTAAVSPFSGPAGAFTFYATWADPAMGAPASLNVVVDGMCTVMARELGTDTLNATYKATATLAAGCHNYYVVAMDAGGAAVTYPTTGALTVSVGNVACDADYLPQAPPSTCNGGGGAGGAGSGGAPAGSGGTSGSGGASPGSGGAAGGLPGSGGAPGAGTGGTNAVGSGGRATGGAPGTGGATSATGGSAPTGSGSGGSASGGSGGATPVGAAPSMSGGCSFYAASPSPFTGAWAAAFLLLARRRARSPRR
jgi:hypothetical protein